MKANEQHGTFWVIDGMRIKKKQPFLIKQITRQLNVASKNNKEQTPMLRAEEPLMVDQRNFFTEKSYEDIADKRMDYGMIRFSSLSSMRGGEVYPTSFYQQTVQNVVICSPPRRAWNSEKKYSLYKDQFTKFQYNRDSNTEQNLRENST